MKYAVILFISAVVMLSSCGTKKTERTEEESGGGFIESSERLQNYEQDNEYLAAVVSGDPPVDFYIYAGKEHGRYELEYIPLETGKVFNLQEAFVSKHNLVDVNDTLTTWELKFGEVDMSKKDSMVIGFSAGKNLTKPTISYVKGFMDELKINLIPEVGDSFSRLSAANFLTPSDAEVIVHTMNLRARDLDGFLAFWEELKGATFRQDRETLEKLVHSEFEIMGTVDEQFQAIRHRDTAVMFYDECLNVHAGSYMLADQSLDGLDDYFNDLEIELRPKLASAGPFLCTFREGAWGVSRVSLAKEYEEYNEIIKSVRHSQMVNAAASQVNFMPDFSTITFTNEGKTYEFLMDLTPAYLADLEIYTSEVPEGSAFPVWTLNKGATEDDRYQLYFDSISYEMPLSLEVERQARLKKIVDKKSQ